MPWASTRAGSCRWPVRCRRSRRCLTTPSSSRTMRPDVPKLRGSIVPMITPFTESGEIHDGALHGLIDRAIEAGSHGISVTGTTGEPSALTLEEREHVMEVGTTAVGGRVPFVPGTGTNNLD